MPLITDHEYTFTSSDGTTPIRVREWIPDGEITGVFQIAHGVAEYIDRYADFARFLAASGFAVVGNDHLGHGKSIAGTETLGFFSEQDGWNTVVDDMEKLRQITAKKWPSAPYFLFGHSMGSFLARTYLIRYPAAPLSGAILSGTGQNPAPMILGGQILCRAEIAKHGPHYQSERINTMAFGSYNKGFEPHRTEFDWLSADGGMVDAYVADPLCGFVPTTGLFLDMMNGLAYISKKRNLGRMNKNLPVYFMSGKKDPVGGNGTGVKKVYGMFLAAGMKDVFCKFYEDGRHEMLNEKDKEKVYADIHGWMTAKLKHTGSSATA
jgi:alpha-beta hydrolase superfamily lysophospholipase